MAVCDSVSLVIVCIIVLLVQFLWDVACMAMGG